jgi:dihydrofolate synthase/folylpolyglutamate synthase
VDIAIIEVGMGGRLDATNIITPLVSVITNIGLDHTVSNTIEAIAGEKQVLQNQILCSWRIHSRNKAVLQLKLKKKLSNLFCFKLISENYPSDLTGITKFIIKKLYYKLNY